MIVCSCAVVTDREIASTIEAMCAEDPWAVVTPGGVYHRLGRRFGCLGCRPLVVSIIERELGRRRPPSPKEPQEEENN